MKQLSIIEIDLTYNSITFAIIRSLYIPKVSKSGHFFGLEAPNNISNNPILFIFLDYYITIFS